jgi:hypothetical protein
MTTLNGQSFSDAFAKVYTAMAAGGTVATQPWFEAALERNAILNTQVDPLCYSIIIALSGFKRSFKNTRRIPPHGDLMGSVSSSGIESCRTTCLLSWNNENQSTVGVNHNCQLPTDFQRSLHVALRRPETMKTAWVRTLPACGLSPADHEWKPARWKILLANSENEHIGS